MNATNGGRDTIVALADLFPAAFSVLQSRRRPLKVGIFNDIAVALNGAATTKELALALTIYTGNAGYLLSCKQGATRVDLNGNAAGQVTADEAQSDSWRSGPNINADSKDWPKKGPRRKPKPGTPAALA